MKLFLVAAAQQQADIWSIAKSMGYFLLVMAVIFGALLLTKWIGKKWGNHKK